MRQHVRRTLDFPLVVLPQTLDFAIFGFVSFHSVSTTVVGDMTVFSHDICWGCHLPNVLSLAELVCDSLVRRTRTDIIRLAINNVWCSRCYDCAHQILLICYFVCLQTSISALQWLCNADKCYHNPAKRLLKFFSTLYACMVCALSVFSCVLGLICVGNYFMLCCICSVYEIQSANFAES